MLFNGIDEAVHHFRRYAGRDLLPALQGAGFRVGRLYYFNAPGILGWFLYGHVLRRRAVPETPAAMFDRLVPLFRWLERMVLRGRVGVSLIAIWRGLTKRDGATTSLKERAGRLNGAAVLITGGSSGIGRQLALDMARLGARVAIASRDEDTLADAEAELLAISRDSLAVPCDVTRMDDVDRMASAVLSRFGQLDILVNNAGYAVYRTFESTEVSEICHLADVNLLGAMRCIRAFVPAMIERRHGCIVNMSSIAGRIPLTPNSVYCASKHGLVALSEALRFELHDFNIRLHVVCPGRAETPFFAHETFRNRAPRAETRYTVTVEEISQATMNAIRTGRFMTYVPRTLGLLAWSMNALPWITKPLFGRLMVARVRSYYARGSQQGAREG
jgi:short-subunit dehydrogenase